jgi:hypothetical protein
VAPQRAPEVSGDHAPDIADVLHVRRPIQAELGAQALDLRRLRVHACDERGGISGNELEDREGEDGHGEQDEAERRHAPRQVGDHDAESSRMLKNPQASTACYEPVGETRLER